MSRFDAFNPSLSRSLILLSGCPLRDSVMYKIAAEKGVGVLTYSSYAPITLAEQIREYKTDVKRAKPVGAFINDQWANYTVGHCGDNNEEAQELGAQAIKAAMGPGRPYSRDQVDLYKNLLNAWGGVPDHLEMAFRTMLGKDSGLEEGAKKFELDVFRELDARTLSEQGIIVAGDPESCIEGVKRHQESGADQIILMMQSDQMPHEKTMRSIELFGKHVIPAFRN